MWICRLTFSKPNLECKGQWQNMQGEMVIFWAEKQAAKGGLLLLKKLGAY